jgi:hypothetical protein
VRSPASSHASAHPSQVAPLSSSSLIANVLFARLLLGTLITRLDIVGTIVIILGVCGVVGFSNIRVAGALDTETNLDLPLLVQLWTRPGWLAYFVLLQIGSLALLWVASITGDVLREREEVEEREEDLADRVVRRQHEARADHATSLWARVQSQQRRARELLKSRIAQWAHSKPDALLRKLCVRVSLLTLFTMTCIVQRRLSVGGGRRRAERPDRRLCFRDVRAVRGPLKVTCRWSHRIKLLARPAQFAHVLSIFIGPPPALALGPHSRSTVIMLAATAIAQIICLNKGLALAPSTLIVPVFFGASPLWTV